MSKLTPSERKQIINDYVHGIPNEDYRVIKTSNGGYQVRKRVSKFKVNKHDEENPVIEREQEKPVDKQISRRESSTQLIEEKPKDADRLTNEDLLRKLSTLLNVPERSTYETPEEFEHEEEAYHEDQQLIQRTISNPGNRWMRKRLSLY